MTSLRIIFCGTPEFALPAFQALLADPEIEIVGVMTQPDRPSGRGQKLTPPPVKVLALENGLTVKQPERLRKEPDMIAWLNECQPDFLVTAAFGQILSQEVLDIPKYGTVNVHASLLPKGRGANPIQWSILLDEPTAGVTTMLTSLGVDEGPMLLKAETDIDLNETAGELLQRLAVLGGNIIVKSLKGLVSGEVKAQEQDAALSTHAPKLNKEDAWINWSQPAQVLHNKIRGQHPWPGTQTQLFDQILKITRSESPRSWANSKDFVKQGKVGEILAIIPTGIVIQTGDGPLLVTEVQPAGKPKMAASAWANGTLKNTTGHCFSLVEVTV